MHIISRKKLLAAGVEHSGLPKAGNRFRLISEIYYEDQVLLVREILTHAEYDKENWKK